MSYNFKDELAGALVQCRHGAETLRVPAAPPPGRTTPHPQADPAFDRRVALTLGVMLDTGERR